MAKSSTTLTVKKAVAIDNYIDSLRAVLQEVQASLQKIESDLKAQNPSQQKENEKEMVLLWTLREDLRKRISDASHERDEATEMSEKLDRQEKIYLVRS